MRLYRQNDSSLIYPTPFARYVVVQVVPENEAKATGTLTLSDYAIYNCVLRLVQQHYGDLGAAAIRSGLKCKYCNDQTRIAIIRIKHHPHRFVTSVLPLANAVGSSALLVVIYFKITFVCWVQCNRWVTTP